jgi:peptidoglycan/xylan/chitin deacetylase (PgdA/CDA1 family)
MPVLLALLLHVPPILMYHRVDVWAPADRISQALTVTPAAFGAQLAAIRARGMEGVGVDEFYRLLRQHRSSSKLVLITFDDGYSDQYRYALPILRRYGMSATFFINTSTIGTARHLTWSEIRTMARDGMSIGAHGVEHVDLGDLNRSQQSYQIFDCVEKLRKYAAAPVIAYAYPSGDFDRTTVALERAAGILFGFTTDPRFTNGSEPQYELTRIRVERQTSITQLDAALEQTRPVVPLSLPKA